MVLGLVARAQVRRSGEEGGGIALAAIIISAVYIVLFTGFIVFVVVLVNSYPGGLPSPTYTSTPS